MKKVSVLYIIIFLSSTHLTLADEILHFDLPGAVNAGIRNNRELKFKGNEILVAGKNLNLKYRDFLPELKLGYSESASVAYYNPDSHIKKISAGLSKEIYDRGVKQAGIRLGKKELSIEKMKLIESEEDFTFQIITSFKEILKLEKEFSILEETYNNTSLQVEIGRKELELGEITEINYLEMKIALSDMSIMLEKKKLEKEKMLFSFSRLLTLKPDTLLSLEGEIDTEYNGFTENNPELFIRASREKSTSYMEIILAREQAGENLKAVKKQNIPDIRADCTLSMSGDVFPLTEPGLDISVTFSFSRPGFPGSISTGISREEYERTRTVTAEAKPFSAFENLYAEDSALVALERSAWAVGDYRINIEFTIREILHEIEAAKKELEILREKLKLGERKYLIEELQLKLGEIKRIDFIESGIVLSKERITILNSISDLYQKEINLMKLCGIREIIKTGERIIK